MYMADGHHPHSSDKILKSPAYAQPKRIYRIIMFEKVEKHLHQYQFC